MGAEVVESALPAFKRQWDRDFKRFVEAGLYSREPEMTKRRHPAIPVGQARLEVGRDYAGQLDGVMLHVIDEGRVVAEVPLPLDDCNWVRNEGHGAAIVHVEESARPISGVADVSIR